MSVHTVSAKGWVVIPRKLREKYGLAPGRSIEVVDYGGVLAIVPVPDDPVAAMSGMFAGLGAASWTDELLHEHRRERDREERRAAS